MKIIGLIGGTGWESTAEYYRLINEKVNAGLGELNFARCVLYSFNYGEIYSHVQSDDLNEIYKLVLDASGKIITAGSDCIILCANTLHMYADELQKEISVPIVHIAEATAREIGKSNLTKVGLLGTKFTMEKNFYKDKLAESGIDTIIPSDREREFIHSCIFDELLKSVFKDQSKRKFLEIIENLKSAGAEGIVLGCTEIPLIIKQSDVDIPLFDTTDIHSQAAVDFALK